MFKKHIGDRGKCESNGAARWSRDILHRVTATPCLIEFNSRRDVHDVHNLLTDSRPPPATRNPAWRAF